MKKLKKFILLPLLLLLIMPCFILTACNKGNSNCYFTTSNLPTGVSSIGFFNSGEDENGSYIEKNVANTFMLSLAAGYQLNDLKVFIGENEVSLTQNENSDIKVGFMFNGSFTPRSNFEITFTGSPALESYSTSLTINEASSLPTNSYSIKVDDPFNIFNLDNNNQNTITFTTISAFQNAVNQIQTNTDVPFGATLTFTLSSNPTYTYLPNSFVVYDSKNSENIYFEHSVSANGEYIITITFYGDANLVFSPEYLFNSNIMFLSNGYWGIDLEGINSKLFTYSVNRNNYLYATDFNGIDEVILTVNCEEYENFKTYYDEMEFIINDEIQTVNINQDTGTFEIILRKPYEYSNANDDSFFGTFYISSNLAENLAKDNLVRVFDAFNIEGGFAETANAYFVKNNDTYESANYYYDGQYTYVNKDADIYFKFTIQDVELDSVSINGTIISSENIDIVKNDVNNIGTTYIYVKIPADCNPETIIVETH